jgi:hypothetical protein
VGRRRSGLGVASARAYRQIGGRAGQEKTDATVPIATTILLYLTHSIRRAR